VILANNQSVSRYLVYTFPYPYTLRDAEWWIGTGSKTERGDHSRDRISGVFCRQRRDYAQSGWREHLGEIGYWVAEDYWGKGIATAALREND